MRGVAILALAGLLPGCAGPGPSTICEAYYAGSLEEGASLRLEAVYSTDGAQVAFFRDHACAWQDVGLILDSSSPTARAFREEIAGAAGPFEPLQRYRLDVSGTYRETYGATSNVLVVERVHSYARLRSDDGSSNSNVP